MEGSGEGSNDCLVRVRAASSRLFRREESARGIEATLLQWSAQALASFCVVKKQSLFSSESRAHFFLDIFFSSALFFLSINLSFFVCRTSRGKTTTYTTVASRPTPVTTPPVTTRFFGSSSFSRGLFRLSFFFPSSRTKSDGGN
jgi:hypothetical protein